MLFRSLRTLATRTLAAGAASALALTLFNAAQPSLGGSHKLSPGTLRQSILSGLESCATLRETSEGSWPVCRLTVNAPTR